VKERNIESLQLHAGNQNASMHTLEDVNNISSQLSVTIEHFVVT